LINPDRRRSMVSAMSTIRDSVEAISFISFERE
jgi:hypothetical protein